MSAEYARILYLLDQIDREIDRILREIPALQSEIARANEILEIWKERWLN